MMAGQNRDPPDLMTSIDQSAASLQSGPPPSQNLLSAAASMGVHSMSGAPTLPNQARAPRNATEHCLEDDGAETPLMMVSSTSPKASNVEDMARLSLHRDESIPADYASSGRIESCEQYDTLLEKLGLTEWFPSKIKRQHVLHFSQNINHQKPSLKNVPWNFIRRLIRLDYRCCEEEVAKCSSPQQRKFSGSSDDFESFLFSGQTGKVVDDLPNPTDVMMLTYACCDPFLQQHLAHKMNLCKMAIPLMIPLKESTKFALWPMRNIVLEWKNEDGKPVEVAMVDYPMPIVSFLRIGDLRTSKSKVMNEVISDKMHNIFTHYNSEQGSNKKTVSKGLVELTPYLPSRKLDCVQDREIIFLNVHGDITDNFDNFLLPQICKMSSILVAMVETKNLDKPQTQQILKQLSENNTVILLLSERPQHSTLVSLLSKLGDNFKKNVKKPVILDEMNDNERKKEVRNLILKYCLDTKTLADCKTMMLDAKKLVTIDENQTQCLAAHEKALQVIKTLGSVFDLASKKDECLLLQTLWHQWCELNKKQHSVGSIHSSTLSPIESEEIEDEKKQHRQNQIDICKNVQGFMKIFLDILTAENEEESHAMYFVKWLQYYLNELSRKKILPLREKYLEMHKNYTTAKMNDEHDWINHYKAKLDELEAKIVHSSFGMEHIFREVGQMYECTTELNEMNHFKQLPHVVAKLLLNGFPFELMDGDANSIPTEWIKAILHELETVLSDRHGSQINICVLSVVGIQSSGKSTLLNALFGLEFAVSAGRCTRGIYAQLVPVDHRKCGLPFEYMLVLDTEGLRAPERGSEMSSHDNRLATMAIGLSDFTLVNLYGENPSEIQDVLQIVVHAFLRMKIADKFAQRHCGFIHQNVAAPNVDAKMYIGMQKAMEELDRITQEAAETETGSDKLIKFKDVIDHDQQKSRWYFPCFWDGNPPGDPVNPLYSEMVELLRNALIIEFKKQRFFPNVEKFQKRLEDVWHAVLTDDFVFGFKNSLALKAFTKLDARKRQLLSELEDDIASWFEQVWEIFIGCADEAALDSEHSKQANHLKETVTQLGTDIQSKMETFIKQSDDQYMTNLQGETIADIRAQTELLCHKYQQDLQMQVYRKSIDYSVERIKFGMLREIHEIQWQNISSGTIKDTQNEVFDAMWKRQLEKYIPKINLKENIADQMKDILENAFGYKGMLLLQKELHQHPLNELPDHIGQLVNLADEIDLAGLEGYIEVHSLTTNRPSVQSFEQDVRKDIRNIFNEMDDAITEICRTRQPFQKVLGKQMVEHFNQYCVHYHFANYTLFSSLRIKLAVLVAQYATEKFKTMNKAYEKNEGLEGRILKIKTLMSTHFQLTIDQKPVEIRLTELLKGVIEERVTCAIETKLGKFMIKDTCNDFGNYFKYIVIAEILEELADQGDVHKFLLYISEPSIVGYQWLMKYTKAKFFNKGNGKQSKYAKLAIEQLENFMDDARSARRYASRNAVHHADEQRIQKWIELFCQQLKEWLLLSKHDLEGIFMENMTSASLERVDEIMTTQLDELRNKLEETFDSIGRDDANFHGKFTPYHLIWQRLWGCTESCPLCGEPCMREEHLKGDHRCFQHRIGGVNGRAWHDSNKLLTTSCSLSLCRKQLFSCICKRERHMEGENRVAYHKYREYRSYYPDWDIQPDNNDENQIYWKWFMCQYHEELAKHYRLNTPDIPEEWRFITKDQAKAAIRKSMVDAAK